MGGADDAQAPDPTKEAAPDPPKGETRAEGPPTEWPCGEQGGTDTEGKAPSSRSSSSNRRSDEEAEEVSPAPSVT